MSEGERRASEEEGGREKNERGIRGNRASHGTSCFILPHASFKARLPFPFLPSFPFPASLSLSLFPPPFPFPS